MRYVALLRGINVGGSSLVPMSVLRELFANLHFEEVKTFINSGNVIFSSPPVSQPKLVDRIEKALEKEFSWPIRVIVKSLPEMRRIVEGVPSSWKDATKWRANVIFLSHRIDKPSIVKDLPCNPKIESLEYRKGVLYHAVLWKDRTRSRVAKINRLPVYREMTIRNPNTTRKIYDLMRDD